VPFKIIITTSRWGLSLDRRSASEIGRARAAVGEHVLFDVSLKVPHLIRENKEPDAVFEVQTGGSGKVLVPFLSNLKVYAGIDTDVSDIEGRVDVYAGHRLNLKNVYCLGNASAGGSMTLDCRTMAGKNVKFEAGGDLLFQVADLTSARVRVKDLGSYWEASIGSGEASVYLKSGGDVTLVTDRHVEGLPPLYLLGKIERPASA